MACQDTRAREGRTLGKVREREWEGNAGWEGGARCARVHRFSGSHECEPAGTAMARCGR